METYRQESRESISKVVEKIAEQFDAVQLSLDDLMKDTATGMRGIRDAVSELHKSHEEMQLQMEQMQKYTADSLSSKMKEYQSQMQDEIARVRKDVEGYMEEMNRKILSFQSSSMSMHGCGLIVMVRRHA